MINNFKIAIRNLLKQKYFITINVVGLAFGIVASVLIFLWIGHEKGFDKYHEDYKDIYRITTDASLNNQDFKVCLVPSALAEEYINVCPEVKQTARCSPYFDQVFQYEGTYFKEEKVIMADTGFFKMFHFTFLEGNPEKPFNDRESVVLTKSIAKKYFGDESAVGKSLILDQDNSVTVSAVIEDLPLNSHNQFSVALYFSVENDWGNFNWMTFVKLIKGHSRLQAQMALDNIIENSMLPILTDFFGTTIEKFKMDGNYIKLALQPLTSVHLNSEFYGELEPAGNKTYITFFTFIALFILVIAGINYMNLSIAYYDKRKKEVGIRKANGATRGILFRQFLFESFIVSCAAYSIGILLIHIFQPLFVRYLDIVINEGAVKNISFLSILFIGVLVLGWISGLYPAAYLSRFNTVSILRNKRDLKRRKGISLRSALIVIQFAITIMVIISTLLIKKQVTFMLNKGLGYNKEQLIVLEGVNRLGLQKEAFKVELKSNPKIENICYSDTYPGENYNNIIGWGIQEVGSQEGYVIKTIGVGLDYFDTYQMEIVKGRKFEQHDRGVVILNERAVKILALDKEPLNYHMLNNGNVLSIVGVVRDFHHDALSISLDPMVIRLSDERYLDNAVIRLAGSDTKESIKFIEYKWNVFSNNLPFEYAFLDNKIKSAYQAEMKVSRVFTIFSVLSIIIACMGILGIASFMMQRRIKEIGIRKANGAKIIDVLVLLNIDYIRWIIISFIIATPLSWFAMHKWLENFAYKTTLSWWIFALAGILAMGIALLTVSWQSWKAARRNPVEALRYE